MSRKPLLEDDIPLILLDPAASEDKLDDSDDEDEIMEGGYKLFVLSGVSGFAYNFEIYTGQDNLPHKSLPSEPDLGASANNVVRLLRKVPNGCNYKVYFDNYYTAIPLLAYLGKKGIHTVGTVRRNRIQNCKLPTDQEIKKCPRGLSFLFVADFEGLELANVLWKDNKNVTLLSSFVGVEPENDISRIDRRERKSIMVKCPAIVKEYNRHMGGVDLLDSMMGHMRLVYHLMDLAFTNAWFLYKRATGNTTLILLKFRKDLALTLLKINTKQKRPRTNDSLSVERLHAQKQKTRSSISYTIRRYQARSCGPLTGIPRK